jgi:hypothetical protein
MIRKFIWLIVLLVGVFGVAAQAIDIETVAYAHGLSWYKHSTRIGESNRLIAWMDDRDGISKIYASAITPTGELLWEIECSSVQDCSDIYGISGVLTTSDGNAIIYWRYGSAMLAQAISPQGEMLWQNDIALIPSGLGYESLRVVPDLDGGIYVLRIWQSLLSLRHLTASGADIIPGGFVQTMPGEVYSLGTALVDDEGCIVTAINRSINSSFINQVYRFNGLGVQMGDGPLLSENPFGSGYYDIISDNEGNLYCYTVQYHPNYGYKLLKFDENGLIPGEEIGFLSGGNYSNTYTSLVNGQFTGCFYVVSKLYSGSNYFRCEIYKYNNQYQAAWSNPLTINSLDNTREVQLWEGSEQNVWVATSRLSSPPLYRLSLYSYNSEGNPLWANPTLIAESDSEFEYLIAWGNDESACLLWKEQSDSLKLVYQSVSISGEVLLPASGNVITSLPRGSYVNKAVYASGDNTICIFEKTETKYPGLYYQVYDAGLHALLEPYGRRLYPNSFNPPTVMDTMKLPNGNVAILYSLNYSDYDLCYLQQITPVGEILYPDYGVEIYYFGSQHTITNIGNDILVTWQSYSTSPYHIAIKGQLVSQGVTQWPDYGLMLAWISGTQAIDKYVMQGNYLVWQESNSNNKLISVKRIDENGNADPNWLLYQLDVAENMELMDAVLVGDDVVILFRSAFDPIDARYHCFAKRYDPMGQSLWGDTGIAIYNQNYENEIDTIEVNDNRLIIKFSTNRSYSHSYHEMFLVRLEFDGSLPWGINGRYIGTFNRYTYYHALAVDENDVYRMWAVQVDGGTGNSPMLHLYEFDPLNAVQNGTDQTVTRIVDFSDSFQVADDANYSYISWHDRVNGSTSYTMSLFLARVVKNATGVIDAIEVPAAGMKLLGNFPNPFSKETSISIHLEKNEKVSIQIYNIKGQLVKTLANSSAFTKGETRVMWDGKDNDNKRCSAGVYLYKVETPHNSGISKMLLLR